MDHSVRRNYYGEEGAGSEWNHHVAALFRDSGCELPRDAPPWLVVQVERVEADRVGASVQNVQTATGTPTPTGASVWSPGSMGDSVLVHVTVRIRIIRER